MADKNDVNLVQDLVDALRQHSDFHRIHPYDDLNCLKIVLNCIDRNAVKHRMVQEGDYQEMVSGLNEITELISKGTINRKSKGKSVDDFQDDVNQSRNGNSNIIWIGPGRMRQIDALKTEIIALSNAIARQYGIAVDLRMTERI